MKAFLLSMTLILAAAPVWSNTFNTAAREAFEYEREGDDWDGNCCTAADPVDSNMCFDSWEEYDQACKTPPAPEPVAPTDDKN